MEHGFILLCDKNGQPQARMLFPSIIIRLQKKDWLTSDLQTIPQNNTISFLKKRHASDPTSP